MKLNCSPNIFNESLPSELVSSLHPTFQPVNTKIRKWLSRFSHLADETIFMDLMLLFLLSPKSFLDHRSTSHLFRLTAAIHLIQKKLIHSATFFPQQRHLQVKWISTALHYPFTSKPILGCVIGFNMIDRYELFDEENILLALKKHLPDLRLVKESVCTHTTQHKNLKLLYLEIEKPDGSLFTVEEQNLLKSDLEVKVKNSIQKLSPSIFMGQNEEEIYKNILVLSHEIKSFSDLPQAHITFESQTGSEIAFQVILVHVCPIHRFSLEGRFIECGFTSHNILSVRQIDRYPIEAHIFTLRIAREEAYLRSDGSLHFYIARQRIVDLLKMAIGEFRDYNGGIIVKQQELLQDLKDDFSSHPTYDPEFMEAFFYALTPIVRQVLLTRNALSKLFGYFLETRETPFPNKHCYIFNTYHDNEMTYLVVKGNETFQKDFFSEIIRGHIFKIEEMTYNIIQTPEGILFNCILSKADRKNAAPFIKNLQESLEKWQQKNKKKQTLRIALEYDVVSLDPRIGGDMSSGHVLRLLFEGLTRFDQYGSVENALAESVKITHNSKQYTFTLRNSLWSNGARISAFDFEYAWKKILSPDFKTAFAYLFYPIKNAREAKEGKVSCDDIGIYAIDDRTLKVELIHPVPYFLQLTAHPLFSPVNRSLDAQHPQWAYQSGAHYVCNGPFQLAINQQNQGYQLIRNPYYWDPHHSVLDQIVLKKMSPSQALQGFQAKEFDWIGNPFGVWDCLMAPNDEGRVISFTNRYVCWSVFNTTQSPFHHPKIRQAFAYAIQRAKIVENALFPLHATNALLLPNQNNDHNALFPDYNPEKARQLFKEGLKELNLKKEDLPPVTFTFHEKGIHKYVASCLKQQFEECFALNCEINALPWSSVFQQITKGNFQIAIIFWYSWVNDPIYTLEPFKSVKHEVNFSKWEHPQFQKLITQSEEEINPFLRSAYLQQAEDILSREMPIIPLYYNDVQALVTQDLHVIDSVPCGTHLISRSFFKETRN